MLQGSTFVPQTLYLAGARWEGGDWRDVQNLELIHVAVQYDGGSVHISGPGRRVHLREVVIDELADYRSFAHSWSTDDCDTQRLHHSWSTGSAPWTATPATDVTVHKHSWIRWNSIHRCAFNQQPVNHLNCVQLNESTTRSIPLSSSRERKLYLQAGSGKK